MDTESNRSRRGGVVALLNPIHLARAAQYTAKGLSHAVRRERPFQQELIVGAAGVPLAVWLGDDGIERALLIASLLLVLVVELVNSALETVVDRVGAERHELSGRAKNLGSAAVFVALVNVVVVWALVLLG